MHIPQHLEAAAVKCKSNYTATNCDECVVPQVQAATRGGLKSSQSIPSQQMMHHDSVQANAHSVANQNRCAAFDNKQSTMYMVLWHPTSTTCYKP